MRSTHGKFVNGLQIRSFAKYHFVKGLNEISLISLTNLLNSLTNGNSFVNSFNSLNEFVPGATFTNEFVQFVRYTIERI